MTPDLLIYNMKDGPLPAGVIRVDRGTSWGNPFIMYGEYHRDEVCNRFELYAAWRLTIEPDWLKPLRGKSLACWCAPKRCHVETLMRLANE